jgi:hypothetical protein
MPLLLEDVATVVGLAMKAALSPVKTDVGLVTSELAALRAELAARRSADKELTERLAALETRPAIPGPPGANGTDGAPGPPGASGTFGESYKDVYQAGTTYAAGDIVTDDGIWLCKAATTTDRPRTSAAWKLILSRPDRKR